MITKTSPILNRRHNDYLREVINLRAEDNDKKMIVEGKAITYEDETLLFSFGGIDYYEVIKRGAFTGAELNEAYFKYNHSDTQLVLARFKNGTLSFDERDDGVYIRAELSNTTLGKDLYEAIRRGDIDKMSFAFTIKKESAENDKENKRVTFRVEQIGKIYDVAAVPHPAFENTNIYARRQQEVEADVVRVEALKRAKDKLKLKIKLRSYLTK